MHGSVTDRYSQCCCASPQREANCAKCAEKEWRVVVAFGKAGLVGIEADRVGVARGRELFVVLCVVLLHVSVLWGQGMIDASYGEAGKQFPSANLGMPGCGVGLTSRWRSLGGCRVVGVRRRRGCSARVRLARRVGNGVVE